MKKEWKLQDAKARFCEVVERALSDGPQHVTRRGRPAVVILSEAEYEKSLRTKGRKPRGLHEILRACPAPEVLDFIEDGRRAADFGRPPEAI